LRRTGPAPPAELRALVQDAFAHRRKAMAGSLALAGARGADIRDRTRSALIELGQPADARAERLAPGDFARLAEMLTR
jgi:16S rRNA (adenine1518-N6/adenine1519-N6)-dimethyltransferase